MPYLCNVKQKQIIIIKNKNNENNKHKNKNKLFRSNYKYYLYCWFFNNVRLYNKNSNRTRTIIIKQIKNKLKTNKMKTTNKTNKAFNYNNSKYLFYDLYEYMLINLDSKEIAIQNNNKMYVFENYFTPQNTGTEYQKQTYKKTYIENKINQITKHIQNEQI